LPIHVVVLEGLQGKSQLAQYWLDCLIGSPALMAVVEELARMRNRTKQSSMVLVRLPVVAFL
jgi:hypothetical protein